MFLQRTNYSTELKRSYSKKSKTYSAINLQKVTNETENNSSNGTTGN